MGLRRPHPASSRLALSALLFGALLALAAVPPDSEDPWTITSRASHSVVSADGARVHSFVDSVVIRHGNLHATSDEARYLEGGRRALLSGHVRMRDDSVSVRAPYVYYDRDRRLARFPDRLVVFGREGTAVAEEGFWYRNENRFELIGDASAEDTSGTLRGDAITWDQRTEVLYAAGNAEFTDDESGVVVTGEHLEYDRAYDLARATGQPSARFEDDDGVVVRVSADRMTYDPREEAAVATGNVIIHRETMEAHADTVTFFRSGDRVKMRGNPSILDGSATITGERIDLEMLGEGERRVLVRGGGRVARSFADDRERPVAAEDAAGPESAEADESIKAGGQRRKGKGGGKAKQGKKGKGAKGSGKRGNRAPAGASDVPPESVTADLPPVPEEAAPGESAMDLVKLALRASATPPPEDPQPKDSVREAEDPPEDDETLPEDEAVPDGTEDTPEEDPTPAWLLVPSEDLPRENLLFGDRMLLVFHENQIARVEVVGHSRSKFFPGEDEGNFDEWNDVRGDSLDVWFTESEVDSVMVRGAGLGEFHLLPAKGDSLGRNRRERVELGQIVDYMAPRIRYQNDTEMMHLDQGAEVHYTTMVITSGEIDLDAPREILVASGDPAPVLVDVDDEIFGHDMRYHLSTQKGEITEGKTQFENGFYHGADIWRMEDGLLAVDRAEYTTCDLDDPHFSFDSRKMKIYLKDKIVAKPVVLKVRGIPVFALPFYMASLEKGRHSGLLLPSLELGVDENRGRFIRNLGYYWAPNDYSDLAVSADFYPQKEQIVAYAKARYHMRYRWKGNVGLKYNRDVPNNRKDTAVEFQHQQTFDENTSLRVNGRFLSSSSVYQEIDDDQRLDRDIRSHATFTKRFPGSNRSLRLEFQRRENLDTGAISEELPGFQFSQPSRPVTGQRGSSGGSGGASGIRETSWLDDVYYSTDLRFANTRDRDSSGETERHVGAKTSVNFRMNRTFFGVLRMSPAVNTEGAWMDRDRTGRKNPLRGVFDTSIRANTTVYGTFMKPIGPALGFRHVIDPAVTWSWTPEFKDYFYMEDESERDRFFSFSGIRGTPREANRGTFTLRNLLQTKVMRDEQEKRYDLLALRSSMSYDFLAEDAGRKPLTNLTNTLGVLSSAPVNQSWSVTHDPYDWRLLGTTVTTRARLGQDAFASRGGGGGGGGGGEDNDPGKGEGGGSGSGSGGGGYPAVGRGWGGTRAWSVDLSHSFQRSSTGVKSSRLVFNSRFAPAEKWRVSFNSQYDLETKENTSQTWSVRRQIHCWEISFDRRLLGGNWQYYMRINVIDLPDIKTERGDKFRGRSGGAAYGGLF
ncbi:MAG: putative LPS assembly protein LptD [Gemmatimonadota bacterium]|nr:putative LPS assembly protein LptD [Gemmatimonadota bacterium]